MGSGAASAADAPPAHKRHNPKQAGRKKARKDAKNGENSRPSEKERRHNPKAFTFASGAKAAALGARAQEMIERRMHAPAVDRSAAVDVPPPTVVAVVGPPGVGKSTLIRSLVKRYTKQNLTQILGPITVVAGKQKRLTFIEATNDTNCLLDVAKIADLVLLLIDASFGFEMETFEFLNMLQVHGFPKVMGVLTHLDSFDDSKRLRHTKKALKQRFWTEIYAGAKLFYLSGVQHGRYLPNEVLNLSRFIATIKFRPLVWRNTHPYVLVDRVEDVTPPAAVENDAKCDRSVIFYGFARGSTLKHADAAFHIPGVGDVVAREVSVLPDPCPFPDAVKKRTLNYRERLIYAPMADVSGILYDRDAVYIDMPSSAYRQAASNADGEEDATAANDLQEVRNRSISLFAGTASLDETRERTRRPVSFANDIEVGSSSSSEDDDAENEEQPQEPSDQNSDNEDDFLQPKRPSNSGIDSEDDAADASDFDLEDEGHLAAVKSKFIGASFIAAEDGDADEFNDTFNGNFDGDDHEESDKNNDETKQPHEKDIETQAYARKKEELKRRFDSEYDGTKHRNLAEEDEDDKNTEEASTAAKNRFAQPITYYDELKRSMQQQLALNRDEFADDDDAARAKVAGVSPGAYVRCVVHRVPHEFLSHFDARYPLILGGATAGEGAFGFVQCRIKRHRWFARTLKNNEPLVFSLGWRRFQSIPVFSLKDGTRNRLLKYTPDHMHCLATFYGPITAPNTGLCAFRTLSDDNDGNANGSRSKGGAAFRVAATGVVLEIDAHVDIVKKLKLVGYPLRINRNTAFIKEMFTSPLEVAKFEGAAIRTVSGLRGQIKKAIRSPEGAFRATFEDKILMSDIVFMKTWTAVAPRRFYNPLCNLLLANKEAFRGMRLNAAVRASLGISIASHPDSHYAPVERCEVRTFAPLRVPSSLQAALPYASKPKLSVGKTHAERVATRRTAVIHDAAERRQITLLQQMATVKNAADQKRAIRRTLEQIAHKKRVAADEAKRVEKHAQKRHKIYVKEERQRGGSSSTFSSKRK